MIPRDLRQLRTERRAYPPPHTTCMNPPPHTTCMNPPPHMTCMNPPHNMTCTHPPPSSEQYITYVK